MTCCGKIKNIVQGNINLSVDKARMLVGRPTERYYLAEVRKTICRKCENHTWMYEIEYLKWLFSHGIEVLKNLEDLTILPELPKENYEKRKKLYCRICKCWLPAKAEVKTEKCPLNKWEK